MPLKPTGGYRVIYEQAGIERTPTLPSTAKIKLSTISMPHRSHVQAWPCLAGVPGAVSGQSSTATQPGAGSLLSLEVNNDDCQR